MERKGFLGWNLRTRSTATGKAILRRKPGQYSLAGSSKKNFHHLVQIKVMAKHLKNGKIKLQIDEGEANALTYAVQAALTFDSESMCIYLYCCLSEALKQIQKNKWSFKHGEFLALACSQVKEYIDLPTQAILNEAFQLENKEISFSLNPQILIHGQENEEKAYY